MDGFSLIELAVVVVIVGILLGMVLAPLGAQFELRRITSEQKRLAEARDALIGFAMANRRLPCPDNDGDGLEDASVTAPNNGPCEVGDDGEADSGFLPYQTLGIPATDTWGRLYWYHVDPNFVLAATPGTPSPNPDGLDLLDPATITVRYRDEDKNSDDLISDAAALIISLGPNGYGSTDLNDNFIAPPAGPPTLEDEGENLNRDRIFVERNRTPNRDDCSDTNAAVTFFCEFDDMLVWVPSSLLKLRLVEAGVLP